jgi:AcrR family transcriptional regulator
MKQQLKSERSRRLILDAALDYFAHHGYGATSVRDLAEAAGVSTGNVYHHFPDKETIYLTLLEEYWAAIADPEFPFNRALATGTFPENLEELGNAAESTVRRYRKYVALIYVDVVEFDGKHVRKFYADMSKRFERFIATHDMSDLTERLHPDVSPVSAMMLATRFFLNYFSVEILFGVKNHFGKSSAEVIPEIAGILRRGMLRPPKSSPAGGSRTQRKARTPRSARSEP